MLARTAMIHHGLLLLIALTIFMPAGVTCGQSYDNAADIYRESFELYESIQYEWEEFVPLQQFLDNPTVAPSREARAFLNRYKRSMDLFQRASTRREANFGIDYNDGVMMLLPQLAPMRQVAKMAKADVQVKLFDGDSAGAMRRLASIYGASRHVAQDGTVIGTLVGIAITALAEGITEPAFNRMALSISDAQRLKRTIDRFDEVDPFNLAGALRGEHETLQVEVNKLLDADYLTRRRLIATLESISDWGDELDAHRFAEMSRDEIFETIKLHELFTKRAVDIVQITNDTQATKGLAELLDNVKDGKFGVLTPASAMFLGKLLQQHHKARKMIIDRRAMLEDIINGKPLEDFASSAHFYIRAIEKLSELSTPEELSAIRAAVNKRDSANDAAINEILTALGLVFDLIGKGAARENCDFSPFRPRGRAMLAAPYAAGLYDLSRIMDLQARRTVDADDLDAIVAGVITTIRFSSHLSGDTLHMTSAIAHDAFVRTVPELQEAMSDPRLTEAQQMAIRDALARISRADPFGYGACKVSPRIDWIMRRDLVKDAYVRYGEVSRNWSADRWYFLAAVMESAFANDLLPRHHDETDGYIEEYRYVTDPDDLARLSDLLNEEALENARRMAPSVVGLFHGGESDAIDQLEVPLILNIANRVQRAKRDLARALRATGTPDSDDE